MRLIDADALNNEIDTWGSNDFDKYDFLEAIDNAPTIEEKTFQGQWAQLKETIIELRDNAGTCTQHDVCKFLTNLMGILEEEVGIQRGTP